jgi:hypothetical protein
MAAGGGEGGGSADWLPIYDRVEAILSKSQAEAEALAADRKRLEAADRVQRESLEAARRLQRSVEELQAAAREKDGEIDRLRAEAADARKKLQEVHQVIHSIAISSWDSSRDSFSSFDCVLVEGRRMLSGGGGGRRPTWSCFSVLIRSSLVRSPRFLGFIMPSRNG